MGKKAWKWTGKRIALLAAVESLVGAPVGGVGQAVLEEGLGDGETDVSGGLEELYGFSFTRPVFSPTLQYEGRSYDLALAVGDRWQYWTLTDDGTLWDGTWRYALSGGQAARERLAAWLSGQTT